MLRRAIFLVSGLVLASGCGSGSFVGRRVDNFTAYYNTFYNARKAYNDGYDTVADRDFTVDRDQYLSLFVRPSGQTGNTNFDSAVVKSADVLRRHGDSKWVDDALLLIGKSYFYQENVVGALQKFREVIDRGSELEDEARFWLARTLITSRSHDEALTSLQESLAREGVPTKWRANFLLALGELYVQRQDWEAASLALEDGLSDAKDKDIAGRAQFLLGQVYETMGRYDDAAEAYRNVRKFRPLYELSFAAQLSAIRVEGIYGDSVRALRDLRRMERDDKHFEYLDDIKLLRGRIIQAMGAADEAYNVYFDLLYDPNRITAIRTELLGKVHYSMAELHRDLDGDYALASAHFDTAASYVARPSNSGSRGGTDTRQYAPEAITDAEEMKESFGLYAKVHKTVADMDSLLWLGSLDQETFDAQVLLYRQERARILEQERKEREARLLEQQFRQAAGGQNAFDDRNLPPSKVNPPSANELARAGFLFHKDNVRVDEGRSTFVSKWGDRPRVRNWRRIDAVRSQPAEEVDETEESAVGVDPDDPAMLPEIDISGVPRDSLSRATMLSRRAIARYELGNAFFLSLEMPDSAATLYRLVIEETPNEPVAQRSFYALAEVQKALGDTLSAERLYDEILETYPDSEFSTKILTQRGEFVEEVVPDSAAIATEIYDIVYDEWQSGMQEGIIDQMVLLAATYPGTEASARALLAGAQVHLESAGSDTTSLLAPIPLVLPDSILLRLWPDKQARPPGAFMPNPGESAAGDDQPVKPGVEDPAKVATEANDPPVKNNDTPVKNIVDAAREDSLQKDTIENVPFDAIGQEAAAEELLVPEDQAALVPDSLTADSGISETDSTALDQQTRVDSSAVLSETVRSDSLTISQSAVPQDSLSLSQEILDSVPDSTISTVISPMTDSLAVTLPTAMEDSLSVNLSLPAVDSRAAPEPWETSGEFSIRIIVDDLFDFVARNFRNTPYDNRAKIYQTLLDELRNPPELITVDTTSTDSAGVVIADSLLGKTEDGAGTATADSLGSVLQDSTAIAGIDSVSAESLYRPISPEMDSTGSAAESTVRVADSTGTAPESTVRASIPASTRPDSAAFDEFGNPLKQIAPPDPDLERVVQGAPEAAVSEEPQVGVVSAGAAGDGPFPKVDVVPEDLEGLDDFEVSFQLRPLNSEGQSEPSVVGWTVLLDRYETRDRAELMLEEFLGTLEQTPHRVMLLTDMNVEGDDFVISWGLFPSRGVAKETVAQFSSRLPAGATFLLLTVESEE